MHLLKATCLAAALLVGVCAGVNAPAQAQAPAVASAPIEVKVVVVSMFEIGADTGDAPGEFQLWYEGQHLQTRFKFAHHHDLFMNPKTGVLGMVTGEGTANSATAVMELGMDPRFDLSHAYWLVAGIAGVNPEAASIGSAAWARYIVDGDLAYEIDAREIPKGWSTGIFPLESKRPWDPKAMPAKGQLFELNRPLVDWAYGLTRHVDLGDNEQIRASRARYKGYPNALKPPFVLEGDDMGSMHFWHGKLMNDWASEWMRFWTHGKGNLVMSAMEDTGTLVSLTYLGPTGRVNKDRVLVLRTGSNYSMPPPGVTAAQNLAGEHETSYSALRPAVEAAYKVGSVVVDELVGNWSVYRDHPPTLQ
jgi:purine nucleoside permease